MMYYWYTAYHCIRGQEDCGGENGYGKGIPLQNPPTTAEDIFHWKDMNIINRFVGLAV